MTRTLFAFVVAAGVGGALASAQSSPPSSPPPQPPVQTPSQITTLTGCVSPLPNSRRAYTIADGEGRTYRLTGADVRDYVGKHVEVRGGTKKLAIVGGLYPSPNVAAQAGDYDPAKAAVAAISGPTSNAPRPLVEFKVRSVRVTPGDCPVE